MKTKSTLKSIALLLALILTPFAPVLAQSTPQQEKEERAGGQEAKPNQEKQQEKGAQSKEPSKVGERLEPDDTNKLPADVPAEVQAGRRESQSEEDAAVLPY